MVDHVRVRPDPRKLGACTTVDPESLKAGTIVTHKNFSGVSVCLLRAIIGGVAGTGTASGLQNILEQTQFEHSTNTKLFICHNR